MINQVNLLKSVEDQAEVIVKEQTEEISCDYRKKDNQVGSVVFAYVLIDKKSKFIYVGHTKEPDLRIGTHLAGRTNQALRDIVESRPDDLVELARYKYYDPMYSYSGNSISKWVESFLIAYHNSLDKGFNKQYNYDHDFRDVPFWKDKLPQEILELYLDSDFDELNSNVKNHISFSRQVYKRSSNRLDRLAKEILRDELSRYHSMPIKFTTIIKNSGIANVGNISKFMKVSDVVLKTDRVYKLIQHFETVLGVERKLNLEEELKKRLEQEDTNFH